MNLKNISLKLIIFFFSLSALHSERVGTLLEPARVPILVNGKEAGAITSAAGTKVKIVREEGGKTLIATSGGQTWVESSKVYQGDGPAPIPVKPTPAPIAMPTHKATPTRQSPIIAGFDKDGKLWKWAISPLYDAGMPFTNSDLTWVRKKGKWIVIDRSGKELLTTPFDEVNEFSKEGYASGVVGKKFGHPSSRKLGLVGPSGQMVLQPEWEDVGELINGFVPVKKDGKWGYANASGKLTIPCTWDDVWRFSSAGTAVVVQGRKRGVIDRTGKVLVEPIWDGATDFTEDGVRGLRRGDGWGLIDKAGKLLCEPEWQMEWATRRADLGWMVVWKEDPNGPVSNRNSKQSSTSWLPVWQEMRPNAKFGILGTDGKLLQPAEWNGFLPAKGGGLLYKTGGEAIFIGKYGKTLFTAPLGVGSAPPERLRSSDGLSMIADRAPVDSEGFRYGFLDEQGKLAVPCEFEELLFFTEGMVAFRDGGKWGFLNRKAERVIPAAWDEVRGFHEGRAAVKRDGTWGFLDKTGKLIAEPIWDVAGDFTESLAAVGKKKPGERLRWTFLKPDGSEAFAVASNIVLHVAAPRKRAFSGVSEQFPQFQKGVVRGERIILDKSGGKIDPANPASSKENEFTVARVRFPFEDRYGTTRLSSEWINYFRNESYQSQLLTASDGMVLSGVVPDLDTTSKRILYAGTPAYGWLDAATGEMLVEPAWEHVEQLSTDLVKVQRNGKYGVVKRDGTSVLLPEWDQIVRDDNGMLIVTRNGRKGIFTSAGALPFPKELPGCEFVGTYGLDFMVRQPLGEGKQFSYSLCSTVTGEFHTFKEASKLYWNANQATAGLLWIQELASQKWSLIRRDGTPLGFSQDEKPHKWMRNSRYGIVHCSDQKQVFINSLGLQVGVEKWDQVKEFSEGLAAVKLGKKWGYLAEDGSLKILVDWDNANSFQEINKNSSPKLVASISRRMAGRDYWGLIDSEGKVIVEPGYNREIKFEEAGGSWNAMVWSANGLSYINSEGQPVEARTFVIEHNVPPLLRTLAEKTGIPTDQMTPVGDMAALCWNEAGVKYVNAVGDILYQDNQNAQLVRSSKRASYGFDLKIEPKDQIILIQRPPAFGFVELLPQAK